MKIERSGLVLLAGLAFGSSTVMTRFGIGEIQPLMLVMLRFALASLVFVPILLWRRADWPRDLRTWLALGVVGMSIAAPTVIFALSLQYMSSGVVTIFISLSPLLTAVLSHGWLAEEKIGRVKFLGLLLALSGVLLLLVTRTNGLVASAIEADIRGQLLALCGVVIGALGTIYTRWRLREVNVFVIAGGQLIAALVCVLPFALFWNTLDLAAVTWRGWFAVVYTGLLGSVIPFVLYFQLIKRFGATTASLTTYVMPVASVILGALLLNELITAPLLGGAGLILAGVFLANR